MAAISWCPALGNGSPHITTHKQASSRGWVRHRSCVTMRCAEMREFALYPSYLSIISGTGFYSVKYAHSRYFVVSIIMNEKYLDVGLGLAGSCFLVEHDFKSGDRLML